MIRPASAADVPVLRQLERAAGRAFAEIGMAAVAEDEPLPAQVLRAYAADGRAWVHTGAAGTADTPVAYALAEWVDGNVHIEQVSVCPTHGGQGLGMALVDHVGTWAGARGAAALTLTTFREVAWNAPYYARHGFLALPEDALTPGLRRIRAEEARHGLDRWPRVCMRRAPADRRRPD